MSSWPLRTTAPDVEDLGAVARRKKAFAWLHVSSQEERDWWVSEAKRRDLIVLDCMPCWFLLVCHDRVGAIDRVRMVESILNGLVFKDIIFRGLMFGYSNEDIGWYCDEAKRAIKKFKQKYQKGRP